MMRSRSGISPVVATVILVAVAIVIAIAVAFWASGLVGVFTRYEKIEISAAYYDGSNVVLKVKNTGSADATIDNIYVNGIPLDSPPGCAGLLTVGGETTCTLSGTPSSVTGGSWQSGVTYEVAVHTASGKLYPVSVLIP